MGEITLNYEESMEKLKEIIEKLENDEISLEESMKNFKEGMDLYKHCNSLLNKAEGEVTMILDKGSESVEEIEFPALD